MTDTPQQTPPKPKRRLVLKAFLVLLVCGFLWGLLSDNPFALGFQSILGWKPDRIVLNNTFKLYPRGFRYYTFELPQAADNLSLVGQVSAKDTQPDSASSSGTDASGVEIDVVSESDFQSWLKGEPVHPIYHSGRVGEGKIEQKLPAAAGTYYVVFSNKFDTQSAKQVKAMVAVRHNGWLQDRVRRLKGDKF
jgi:hypothetical protein